MRRFLNHLSAMQRRSMMAGQPASQSSLVIHLAKRIAQTAAVLGALSVIYLEGATAYLNTQKAIEAKAVADNAVLRQQSEGVLAEQKARTDLEIAKNAAERQKGEADKAEADAARAEADAITARNISLNAQVKTRADAETIKAEAELRKQKLIVAIETARNAARRQAAETATIEANVTIKKQANESVRHELEVTDCSKPYRSSGDLTDMVARRFVCGN